MIFHCKELSNKLYIYIKKFNKILMKIENHINHFDDFIIDMSNLRDKIIDKSQIHHF